MSNHDIQMMGGAGGQDSSYGMDQAMQDAFAGNTGGFDMDKAMEKIRSAASRMSGDMNAGEVLRQFN